MLYPEVIGFYIEGKNRKGKHVTMTKTMQASMKGTKQSFCQNFWVSTGGAAELGCTMDAVVSTSVAPATLRVIDPQISQMLLIAQLKQQYYQVN